MASNHLMRINYSKVISQADSISENAKQLSEQIKRLKQLEQECQSVWKGQAANTFIRKLEMLHSEMERTKVQMADLASTIRYCADTIQQQDRRTLEELSALKSRL